MVRLMADTHSLLCCAVYLIEGQRGFQPLCISANGASQKAMCLEAMLHVACALMPS
jgi:hypothetical protein